MKFKAIAANLLNEGLKYRWGRCKLVKFYNNSKPEDWQYCALGIKAMEAGVPPVVLAYYDISGMSRRHYSDFEGLSMVYALNDDAPSREMAAKSLDVLEGQADIEGWTTYLKTLLPEALAWAKAHAYHSLLQDLPKESI